MERDPPLCAVASYLRQFGDETRAFFNFLIVFCCNLLNGKQLTALLPSTCQSEIDLIYIYIILTALIRHSTFIIKPMPLPLLLFLASNSTSCLQSLLLSSLNLYVLTWLYLYLHIYYCLHLFLQLNIYLKSLS